MTGSLIVVKGISGSGKSTRVMQLFSFLKEKNMKMDEFFYQNKKIGYLIKDLDLVIFGNIYKSGPIERFQGFDVVTGKFGCAENTSEFIKDNIKKYSFLIEGAGITQSNRYRPLFMADFCKAKKMFIQFYNYLDKDINKYYERIIYRSGKIPEKLQMWNKNKSFMKEYIFCQEEIKEICSRGYEKNNITLYNDNYDKEVEDFGLKFLKFYNRDDLIDDFILYCKNNDIISINKFENFQDNKKQNTNSDKKVGFLKCRK